MYFNNKKHIIVVMKMLFFDFVIQTHQKALKRSFSNFVFLNLYIDSLVSVLQGVLYHVNGGKGPIPNIVCEVAQKTVTPLDVGLGFSNNSHLAIRPVNTVHLDVCDTKFQDVHES